MIEMLSMDLNRELIPQPISTFFGRVKGSSMIGAGVDDGDVLIIDKSLQWKKDALAVCCLNGDFTLKFIDKDNEGLFLRPANPNYPIIRINEDDYFTVWGIVSYIIKKQ